MLRQAGVSRRPLGLAALCLVAAACSSTAQNAAEPAPVDLPDPAAVLEAPEPLHETSQRRPKTRSRSVGSPTGTGNVSTTAISEEFVAGVTPPSRAVIKASRQMPSGPGVTARTITFGVPVRYPDGEMSAEEQDLNDRTFVTPREWKRAHELVARAINETGGVLGRKVVPLFFEYEEGQYSTSEEVAEAMCTYYTEEHETLAPYGGGMGACMEEAGGVNFHGAGTQIGLDTYAKYPHTLAPVTMSLDRIAANLVHGLNVQRFFRPGDKVGLARWDDPTYDRVVELVLKPALEKIGVELAEDGQVTPPKDGEADYWRAVADAEQVIIKFKAKQINKLMLLGSYSGRNKFMELAEYHQYRPTYGLYTHTGSDAGISEATERQLWGSVGVGWIPVSDVPIREGLAVSPAARRCHALMRAGELGELYDHADRAWYANEICDFWLFFKTAIEAGGPAVTADSVVAGAQKMGHSFEPASTFATRMGPGRQDGVAALRHFAYFRGCGCFRYTSPLYRAL